MLKKKSTYRDLRLDAEFLNRCREDCGLSPAIPNYASMRKDELEKEVSKHQEDIKEYLADYGLYDDEQLEGEQWD